MRAAPLFVLLLGACAGADPAACRSADWYDLGFRDAIFRLQPQDQVYSRQCESHGVRVDTVRYVQGWHEGRYEADTRAIPSQD